MSETTIGGIKVKIGSDTSGFDTGLKKTREGLNQVGKWSAAAAAAAVVGAAAIVKSQLTVLDSLAKTSDALGIQQEKLQALQHIGNLTGTSTEQLNKSIERMEKNLGNAARVGGASADALKDIGVNLNDIIKMSPDKQMETLAVALGNVENQSLKASIANDLFGRNGLRMLKMLDALKDEGLEPTSKAIEGMGIALSRIDTSKVENANDAMFKASEVATGFANKLTVKLSPVLEGIANQFIDAAIESGGFADAINTGFDRAIYVIGVFSDGLHGIQLSIAGIANITNFLALETARSFMGMRESINDFLSGVGSAANDAQNALKKLFGQDNFTKYIPTDAPLSAYFEEELNKTQHAFDVTNEYMNELLAKPLPSDALKAWVKETELAAQQVAEHLTNAIAPTGDTQSVTNVDEKALETAQKEIENLMLLNETKLAEIDRFELEKGALLQSYVDQGLITKEQQEAALTEIERNGAEARKAIADAEAKTKLAGIQNLFSNIASLMNTGSKKAFQIGKAAAIANASINGVSAAVAAWDAGMSTGGPWAPAVAAGYTAASLLKTGSMINQISSQSFGSPSSPTSFGSGGLPQVNTGGSQSQQSQNSVSIDIVGSEGATFSRSQVQSLIGQINDATGDGIVLNTRG